MTKPVFNPLTETRLSIAGLKSWRGFDGIGYQCALLFDGRKVAVATDDGSGAQMEYDSGISQKELEAFDAAHEYAQGFASQEVSGHAIPFDLDQAVAALCDHADNVARMTAKLRREGRSALLFRLKSDAPGSYRFIGSKTKPLAAARVDDAVAGIATKYGADQVVVLSNPRDGVVRGAAAELMAGMA